MSESREKKRSIEDLYQVTEKLMEKEFKKLKGKKLTEKELLNIKNFSKILANGILEEDDQ